MESEDFMSASTATLPWSPHEGSPQGSTQGQPFREFERSSCIFVRQEGQWRCVLTHLSRLAQREAR
jgi:hypothetical protein